MPPVTLRTETAERKEVSVTEYICDMADCPNVAEYVLGFSRGFGCVAVCAPHKRMLDEKNKR